MSELAKKIGYRYSVEKNEQDQKQVLASSLSIDPIQNVAKGKSTVRDITREQWFWDAAVMS